MIGEAAEKLSPDSTRKSPDRSESRRHEPANLRILSEKALAAGALDVYTTPVQMKKNRRDLADFALRPHDTSTLMDLIFTETTTFGARTYRAQRRTLPRESVKRPHAIGDVRVKISRVNGHIRQRRSRI